MQSAVASETFVCSHFSLTLFRSFGYSTNEIYLPQSIKTMTFLKFSTSPAFTLPFCRKGLQFRSRRWGSLLTVCTGLIVCSSPHQHERKFFGPRICIVTIKHLPQPIRSHTESFGTLGNILKILSFVRPNIA